MHFRISNKDALRFVGLELRALEDPADCGLEDDIPQTGHYSDATC